MVNLKFIDVPGVGNSGKSAVNQVLAEVEGVWSPHHFFEFDLIRVKGGLLDLRHSFVEDWSQVRSHASYNEFKSVLYKLSLDPKFWDIKGQFESTSQRYEKYFDHKLIEKSEEFLNSFLIGSYEAEWPFERLTYSRLRNLIYKVMHKTGFRKYLMQEVMMIDGKKFDIKATDYMNSIYRDMIPENSVYAIFNNGFEPFNPEPGLNMIQNSKQIIVLRDPRDVYVSGLNHHNISKQDVGLLPFDNDGLNKSFLATDDLNVFVKRFKLFSRNVYSGKDTRILKINFEDLVLHYDESLKGIFSFLGIDPNLHTKKYSIFNPKEASCGIWKGYSKKEEIKYIEDELSDFLYK